MAPTSPFRAEDEHRFDHYATRVLTSTRFSPDGSDGRDAWDIFRSSLESCWDHLGGTTPQRRHDGKAFRMAAGFVDLISPGAFAAVRGDTHLIGVHTGLVAAMNEISLFFYSQASFFPEVGDPSKEKSPRLPHQSRLTQTIVELTRKADPESIRTFGETITPHDATRYLHAQFMTLLLIRFAWYHEFYHCVNGHIGLARNLGIASALCEVPDRVHTPPANVAIPSQIGLSVTEISHCLELDADRSALWASAKIQLSSDENIKGLAPLDLRLRMKMVLFSAFLLTHFFAEANRRTRKPSLFHPSAEIRLHNLVRTIASNLLDEYPETGAIFREVISEFTTLEETVPSLMRTADLLRDLRSEAFQDGLEKTEHQLRELRKLIARFTYHGPQRGDSNAKL